MAENPDPLERLARIHPKACGRPNGYLQISRARAKLRELGWAEDDLPEYDADCKLAWADYMMARRDHGTQGVKPGPNDLPPLRPVSEGAACGTPEGLKRHIRERRRQRAAGEELTPIDPKCRAEGLRAMVKRARAKAQKINAKG